MILVKTSAPSLRAAGAVLFAALAGSCAGTANQAGSTMMVDPATYLYYTCQQLVTARIEVSQRRRELDSLIEQAERDPGGQLVSTIAYRGDQAAYVDRAKLIEEAWRERSCETARLEPVQPQPPPPLKAPPRQKRKR